MAINYIIAAYESPAQLRRLVDRLSDQDVYFYIHIDKKVDISPFFDALSGVGHIRFVVDEARVKCRWGGIGIVMATLNCMRCVLEDKRDGHCIFISGQDYPIVDNTAIADFFLRNRTKNYILCEPFPRSIWKNENGGSDRLMNYYYQLNDEKYAYVSIPSLWDSSFYKHFLGNIRRISRLLLSGQLPFQIFKKRDISNIVSPYGGDAWWALTVCVVQKMISFLDENPNYLTFFEHVHVPDEIIFQSLARKLIPEDDILPCLTYTTWLTSASSPCVFCEADFGELQSMSGRFLFARKFSEAKDRRIMELIDKHLLAHKEKGNTGVDHL
jgi:hypothetical protein